MSDKITHGVILDVVEQDAEITLEAMDYENFAPGKPFRSGSLTFPETANNRAALNTLFDTDGSNKVRIIEGVTYENDVTTIKGSLVITGQSNERMTNRLTGFFLAGNALMWLDFGDTKLNELDWSFSNHTLNYAAVIASETTPIGDLIVYDLCDRGKFIDTDNVNLTERYPAFNIAKMLKVIFSGYDLQTNFINESWFTDIYLLFTQTCGIRNDEDWKETSLIKVGKDAVQTIPLTVTASPKEFFTTNVLIDFDKDTDQFFDNGSNFNLLTDVYKVPETGTYRFIFDVSASMALGTLPGDLSGTIKFSIYSDAVKIAEQTYTILNQPTNSISNLIVDSDFIELQAGEEVKCYAVVYGEYTGTMTDGDLIISTLCTLENKVSRYYGHGSTVQTSALMPDLKVNDFLKMVFQHFAIVPQYSYETNIVRLNVWQRQQTSFDITPYIDTSTGTTDFSEAFDFELLFRVDSADRWAQEYYTLNPDNTGKYEASNGNKNKEVYTSAFSNTVLQVCFRLDADKVAIPVLWGELPESTVPYPHDAVSEWKTTFNYRLLKYLGVDSVNTYKFGYHVAGDGRTITDENFALFTPFSGLEFCNNGSTTGLYERLHKAFIARLNNGTTLTINGRLPLTYLNNLINNDADTNLTTPVYIGLNPFVGRYTVRSITNNGIQDQLVLILNDE